MDKQCAPCAQGGLDRALVLRSRRVLLCWTAEEVGPGGYLRDAAI